MSKSETAEDLLYKKALEFYEASADYQPGEEKAEEFFERIRKIIYYAMLYRTPEELIHERVEADKPKLGILNPEINEPTLDDLKLARNYLKDYEVKKVDNTITNYLNMATPQLTSGKTLNAEDWVSRLQGLLQMNGYSVLLTRSNISQEEMETKVVEEFKRYNS